MENTWFFCLVTLSKVTFFTKCHVVHLIKRDKLKKGLSKCPWLTQINHVESYILKLQWWCLFVTGLSVLHNPVTVSMAELCGPAGGEHVCASVCASDDDSAF